MNKSVLIIGGGLGGLFTGAILAKEGLRVTVVEKNHTVGGGLQSFTRFGEVFDTGMHIIGGMQPGGNVRRICEYLGIEDRIHISDVDSDMMDCVYFAEDSRRYRIAQGRDNYIDALSEAFPSERENLRAYVDAMYRIAGEVDLFYLRPSTTLFPVHSEEFSMAADAFIAKYLDDRRLRSVVAYMNPLYGGQAGITPAYIHALISILYIEGSSRFAGGSQLFADTLRDYIVEHGSTVIAGDGVAKVLTAGKTISGVVTCSGKQLAADMYICAIHPCTLFSLLDNPSALPKSYRNRLDSIPNAYSAFTLNIKLKEGTFKYMNHSAYYMGRYDDIWNFGNCSENWPMGFLYMTPPSLNQGEYAGKMIVTAPMLWDDVAVWENTTVGRRGSEYEMWKESMAGKLLERLEEVHPGIRECIEAVNTASPLTIRDWYGVKQGSMCGFTKDCNNLILSQVPVVTKIPNLLMTGQNCNLHGFCGVTLTAINTCEAILGQNYLLERIGK